MKQILIQGTFLKWGREDETDIKKDMDRQRNFISGIDGNLYCTGIFLKRLL